jgi:predicted signal transduction protein with EAL and GGDEF domain
MDAGPFDWRVLHVTASIGASTFPRDGEEFDKLLSNADAAMQRVKAEGRNGFQFYARAMTRQATDRLVLENELRRVLERGDWSFITSRRSFSPMGASSGLKR